jgi:hypothetical protein
LTASQVPLLVTRCPPSHPPALSIRKDNLQKENHLKRSNNQFKLLLIMGIWLLTIISSHSHLISRFIKMRKNHCH